MASIFIDGFDKYGPASATSGTNFSQTVANLKAGEYTTATANLSIVAPLSATGQALSISNAGAAATVQKTLSANYSPIIGGFRFSIGLAASTEFGITFTDGGTNQVSVSINGTGTVSVRTAGIAGTALGTSSTSVSANTTHYLEWNITIGTSASYQLYLDGLSVLSGTGNTRGGTANNFINGFTFNWSGGSSTAIIDDFYLFDNTTAVNNAPLLSNPRIETQFPNNDSSVQFSFGAAILGQAYGSTNNTNAPGANELFLRTFTPSVNSTLQSVSCLPSGTSAGANFKSVLYTDSGGSPNSLVATGTQVTGTTGGIVLTSSFSSGQALTSGTKYWIGFITDTSVGLFEVDNTTTGQKAANTYASGAPATAPAMTTGQSSWIIFGNVTGTGVNYYEVDINPPPGNTLANFTAVGGEVSYVFDSTVGHEDLFQFPNLTVTPAAIYTMAVKALIRDATSGARTISLVTSSSGSSSTGSNAGQAPGTTYEWFDSLFDTDPHTSAAWTPSGLNNATSGYEIAS